MTLTEPRRDLRPDAGRARRATGPGVGAQVAITVAVLCAWVLLYVFGLSRLQETRDQHALYSQLREQLARGTAPVQGPITTGSPVAVLQIPRIGQHDLVVVEGTASGQSSKGPGHLRSTPLPGQVGVSVIMGRGLTFGAPFASIDHLRRGDVIDVTTGLGKSKFEVTGTHTGASPRLHAASGAAVLTLVTAARGGVTGSVSGGRVTWVDAALRGTPAAAPSSLPTAAGDESPMSGDGEIATKLELAFALQLLALAIFGSVWTSLRWGRRPAWAVGIPVVFASLWLTSSLAVQLLPNLL